MAIRYQTGAIHKVGGPMILEECIQIRNRQGGCETGEAVITTGGKLPAKYVIHTVGPVWNEGIKGEEEKLRNCYRNSLKLAIDNEADSIAFPNISTGVYRYPKEKAAIIVIDEVNRFLQNDEKIKKVILVCYDRENYELYEKLMSEQGGMPNPPR